MWGRLEIVYEASPFILSHWWLLIPDEPDLTQGSQRLPCWSQEVAEARRTLGFPASSEVVSCWKTNMLLIRLLSQFSSLAVSDSLQPHGLQHAGLPCPSPTPRAYSNSWPSSRWCHPTISSSVVPFSSSLQFFLISGSFSMSQFFRSGGQSIGVSASASVPPMNIQDWFPLGLTGLISLQSKDS